MPTLHYLQSIIRDPLDTFDMQLYAVSVKVEKQCLQETATPSPIFGLRRFLHLASFTFSAEHVKRRSIFYEILNGESLNSKFNAKYFRKKKN